MCLGGGLLLAVLVSKQWGTPCHPPLWPCRECAAAAARAASACRHRLDEATAEVEARGAAAEAAEVALVLLDEIGHGTDPGEAAALAARSSRASPSATVTASSSWPMSATS